MQKKKYFFSLVVFVIMLMGVFGGGMEAKAEKCCYSLIGGVNQCHSAADPYGEAGNCVESMAGSCPRCPATDSVVGCCDGEVKDCTYSGCSLPTTEKWCCIDTASATPCTEINPGGACSKMRKEHACSTYSSGDCKAGGSTGWSCVTNNGKDKAKCTDIEYNGTCKKSGVTPTHDTCAVACASIGGCDKGDDETSPGGDGTSSTSASFTNPLRFNTIDLVLTSLLDALKGLVVTLAIIFIVLGGILYMMSAGDPAMLKRAKDCWTGAVIGLAIVVAAPTFLKQVQIILGGTMTGGGMDAALTIQDIATNVASTLLSIVGIIAIISLVVAGSMYMTAYGDEKRIETAKKMGTYAIIGIIVALGSLVAVEQIKKLITG
jgi:hypothetical protein